ncbi:MAG: hypothetical protein ACP5E3_03305, partial [Bacteroidales bacterium]
MSKFDKIKAALKKWKIYFFFLLAIAAVTAVFPRQAKFRYEFQKGKPWLHETLVAPFDFPIYKPEDVVQAEKDSLSQNFQPYFRRDTSILVQKLSLFRNEIFPQVSTEFIASLDRRGIESVPGNSLPRNSVLESYFNAINALILDIYNAGIVDDPVRLENLKDDEKIVNIIQNQVVEEVP